MKNDDAGELLVHAAAEMLRPIVRHLLAANVPFGRLEVRLREIFVAVADDEFALEDRPRTDSRVALLTGLNRKEVHRIRSRDPEKSPPTKFSRNRAASLIGRWLTSAAATDARGRPQPIPYRAERGPSFVRFAREVAADLPPRAILDELVRTGAVRVGEDRRVELQTDSYVPARGRSEKLRMLAEDPAELIETMLTNILSEGVEPLLQRKVFYDNVGSDGIARLRRDVRRAGESFLRRMNRLFARYDRDRNPRAPGGARQSAGLGVYFFERKSPPAKRPSASRDAVERHPAKERRR